MEKINEFNFKITDWIPPPEEDLSELFLWLVPSKAKGGVAISVNDETQEPYYVYLNLNEETNEIVSAFILHSNNMFDELARAFANMDLNHPDVRFFLEKKLELYAERHRDELTPQPEPALP